MRDTARRVAQKGGVDYEDVLGWGGAGGGGGRLPMHVAAVHEIRVGFTSHGRTDGHHSLRLEQLDLSAKHLYHPLERAVRARLLFTDLSFHTEVAGGADPTQVPRAQHISHEERSLDTCTPACADELVRGHTIPHATPERRICAGEGDDQGT